MATPQDMIALATKEIGYTESPAGSNKTKYAATAGHANGYAWCATFGVALQKMLGMKPVSTSAYTPQVANDAKKAGRVVALKDAQPGDAAVVDFPGGKGRIEHYIAVLVKDLGGGKWETIEGNTSGGGSQTNGGAVMKKTRNLAGMVKCVIFRPHYDGATSVPTGGDATVVDDGLINKGDSGQLVIIWQSQLRDGFGLDELIADGDFGPATEKATKAFQAAHGLPATGEVDSVTIKAMEALYEGKSPKPKGPGHLEEAVRYGGEGDLGAAQLLGTSLDLHVGSLDAKQTVGVVHLVGGPAIRGFDRGLATGSVIEHPGAGRAETLAGVKRYIAERKS